MRKHHKKSAKCKTNQTVKDNNVYLSDAKLCCVREKIHNLKAITMCLRMGLLVLIVIIVKQVTQNLIMGKAFANQSLYFSNILTLKQIKLKTY